MSVILFLKNSSVAAELQIALEAKLSITSQIMPDEAQFLKILESLPDQIYILDYVFAAKIAASLKSAAVNCILCLQTNETAQAITGMNALGFAKNESLLTDIIQTLEKKPELWKGKSSSNLNYCAIRTLLLMKMSPLEVDIYIKLSSQKFLKIFQKGDVFNKDDLKRYLDQKQVNFMYLMAAETKQLLAKINDRLKTLITQGGPPAETVALVEDSVEFSVEMINKFGMTDEVQELVTNSVEATVKALGDFPELGNIWNNLNANPDSYISSHSNMLAHVACALAVSMDWYSEETFRKLSMAAFLHDATLENQKLCAVKNLEDLSKNYKGKFNTAEVQAYKQHPEKAAAAISLIKNKPPEVEKIVLQHHEHPYGTGFPGALNHSYISPLGCLFIVAHDMVDFYFDHDKKIDIEAFLVENDKKYSVGTFKKLARAIYQDSKRAEQEAAAKTK